MCEYTQMYEWKRSGPRCVILEMANVNVKNTGVNVSIIVASNKMITRQQLVQPVQNHCQSVSLVSSRQTNGL